MWDKLNLKKSYENSLSTTDIKKHAKHFLWNPFKDETSDELNFGKRQYVTILNFVTCIDSFHRLHTKPLETGFRDLANIKIVQEYRIRFLYTTEDHTSANQRKAHHESYHRRLGQWHVWSIRLAPKNLTKQLKTSRFVAERSQVGEQNVSPQHVHDNVINNRSRFEVNLDIILIYGVEIATAEWI